MHILAKPSSEKGRKLLFLSCNALKELTSWKPRELIQLLCIVFLFCFSTVSIVFTRIMDPSSISTLFEDSIQISPDEITFSLNPGEVDEPQEANKVLLGKIISKHKLGKAAIQGSLNLSWKAIKGWKWKEIETGLLQFTFNKRDDAMNVLARRPWFVCGALLVIMPWPTWLTPAEVRFDKTPIWVKVESIPPFYWNLSNLKEIASNVHELPPGIEDAVGLSTLRFRATIDLNKPIFSGFFLRRQKLKDLWIQYKYEKLSKLCFKCGLLTHDQSMCFKSPTVVKDDKGNYYPMFRIWLKSDAQEKSTFTTPRAKWFQDWILQKQLGRDPVNKAIRNGEEAEIRETRLQLSSKRRIVNDSDEVHGDSSMAKVIIQLPLVYLSGIGEFAPYANNAKLVEFEDATAAKSDSPDTIDTAAHPSGNDVDSNGISTKSTGNIQSTKTTNITCSGEDTKGAGNLNGADTPIENQHAQQNVSTAAPPPPQSKKSPYQPSDRCNPDSSLFSPFRASPIGTQAQFLKWPSKECWAQPKARELLMGSLTIDKYHKEPTLFNPILNIDEFRVYEHSNGPRKRKASDGFIIYPSSKNDAPNEAFSLDNDSNHISNASCSSSSQNNKDRNEPQIQDNFSLGAKNAELTPRRRGRPRKNTGSAEGKKRGRPSLSQSGLSSTPRKFKRSAPNNRKGFISSVSSHWEGKMVDLKIDLNNHFVVVEKFQNLSNGMSGGFGLCWMKGVQCNILSAYKNVIAGEICSDPPGEKWIILGIYAPPHENEKEILWNYVGDMVLNASVPILLLGDMNGTLKDSECFNYAKIGNSSSYSFDFHRMVNRVGLIDLGFLDPRFTWTKNNTQSPRRGHMKRARLDRGIATIDWRVLFPSVVVNHLPTMVSDHRPILLDTSGGIMCKGQMFKYENMWARDPCCFWVVKEAWAKRMHQNPMINFHRKTQSLEQESFQRPQNPSAICFGQPC
ncbi:hypothetical protein F8388_002013 [Cannabis sativa]|uniref:DUF4283 domain-containing protein n=1 Tax=Cannabis sativa TaxID=3483 RepID=A0A7J6FLI2_CANSA|nr:hypothetical protein F8388_002013 [Cannabis sativa]KAF4391880.1 hypothetical protein G4B88_007455 [Cannabis sativa]